MTVAELGRRMTSRELSEWQAFFRLEAGPVAPPAAPREMTPEASEAYLAAWVRGLGGRDLRKAAP